jgi:anti-sigma factor ChrR (cupin superfamily)
VSGPQDQTQGAPEPYPGDAAHRVICQEVVELLGDYLEGALDDPLRTDVDAHLAACPECRLFLDQLELSVSLVGALPAPEELPADTIDLLVMTFRSFTGH